jgi:hypothetical protein
VTPLTPFPNEDTIDNENYNLWLCASLNRNQDVMNQLIDACKPINISRVAGSGNKIIHLIDQKSDYYINLVPGFKYWDMCASEALIKAKRGIVTDAESKPLIYDHTKSNFTIREGIIVAKNKKVFDLCKERIEVKLGRKITDIHREIAAEAAKARESRSKDTEAHKVIKLDPKIFEGRVFEKS